MAPERKIDIAQPCDMDAIMSLDDKHGLAVIEDTCRSHGAEYRAKRVGSFGAGCLSFYPTTEHDNELSATVAKQFKTRAFDDYKELINSLFLGRKGSLGFSCPGFPNSFLKQNIDEW